MNVATVTMPREQAREKLKALRKQLHRRADAEYEALASGYEALVEGKAVISLEQAIRDAPVDERGRPRLAIARADRRQVHFRWFGGETIGTFSTALVGYRSSESMRRDVDFGRLHGWRAKNAWSATMLEGYALVPLVPPEVTRLVGGSNLRHFFTLWEVEQWSDSRIGAQPDRDPYLLRRLGGDLYAVVAEWELTTLEMLVMTGRRSWPDTPGSAAP